MDAKQIEALYEVYVQSKADLKDNPKSNYYAGFSMGVEAMLRALDLFEDFRKRLEKEREGK